MTTLSVGGRSGELAAASDGPGNAYRWYLGDRTTATGQTVRHRFKPGHYIVTVAIHNRSGCTTTKVVQLHAPTGGMRTLDEVEWCDPLAGYVRPSGSSVFRWPPDLGANPQSKAPPVKVTLGRRHDAEHPGFAVAFGFEVRVTVLGNPAKCRTGQVIRSRFWWDENGKQMERIDPTTSDSFAYDSYGDEYKGRFRTVEPGADGTSRIAWLDFPGVLYSEGKQETAAEVMATFVTYVTGQEAQTDHVEAEGQGETAFLHFKLCAAWNQPSGTRDSSFEALGRGGPDAMPPKQVEPPLAPKDAVYAGPAKSAMQGCGPK